MNNANGRRRRAVRATLGPAMLALAVAGGLGAAGAGVTDAAAQTEPAEELLPALPTFEVPDTVRTEADAMTLREIIERAVEGEKTKLAGHEDMMYTTILRVIVGWKEKRQVTDAAYLAYEDDTGFRRAVRLAEQNRKFELHDGEWIYKEDEDPEDVEVQVDYSDGEEGLARLPFFLEEQQNYSFSLLGRYLEEDHVVFKIGFKPRSEFKPLPSGTVFVDTDDFRIIHEEFAFEGQNPFPLLLKGINRISRQWKRLNTGEWVVSKVMAEIELRGSWMGFMPQHVSFALTCEDYRFNQGYDPRRFGER